MGGRAFHSIRPRRVRFSSSVKNVFSVKLYAACNRRPVTRARRIYIKLRLFASAVNYLIERGERARVVVVVTIIIIIIRFPNIIMVANETTIVRAAPR